MEFDCIVFLAPKLVLVIIDEFEVLTQSRFSFKGAKYLKLTLILSSIIRTSIFSFHCDECFKILVIKKMYISNKIHIEKFRGYG